MRAAAVALFREFPDHFVLFGGANLVLFHKSVRHSADLDLIAITQNRPKTEDIVAALRTGLAELAEVLKVNPLSFEAEVADIPELKIHVNGSAGQRLFRVDFTKVGGVFDSEIEEQLVEAGPAAIHASVQYASKALMLFRKAEAFLFRHVVKARDAYDIYQLQSEGAALTEHLSQVLTDAMFGAEIEPEQIEERIQKMTVKRCQAELDGNLPVEIYDSLKKSEFAELQDALRRLYEPWL